MSDGRGMPEKQSPLYSNEDIFVLLTKHRPFHHLSRLELAKLSKTFYCRICCKGEYLFCRGARSVQFGVIQTGSAEILFDTIECGEVPFETLGPGDIFGLCAATTEQKALYHMKCKEPMVIFFQCGRDFSNMISVYPEVKAYILDMLLKRVENIHDAVYENAKIGTETAREFLEIPKNFKKAIDYINRHYNKSLTLSEVAETAGISKYHFSRLFKVQTGLSFTEYVNHRRIQVAKSAMRTKGVNITQTCFAVGFNDLSYFSRVFKKIEGVSPSSFLNAHKYS